MSSLSFNAVDIHLRCRFEGRFWCFCVTFGQPRCDETTTKDSHLVIFDCRVPLNKDNALPQAELNYNHVDIQLRTSRSDHLASMFPDDEEDYTIRLKRWGVRLLNDDSSAENRLGNPNALPHVCEADEILLDKSLIHVRPSWGKKIVEMHSLVEEMGKEIVCAQSDGEREVLIVTKDVCEVLEDSTGTKKIIGMSLDLDEIDELRIHKEAFKGMRNLRFLNIYTKHWKGVRWHIHEGFNYLPPKLRLLRWDGYPMRHLPSSFCPENLVKLEMQESKLEKLWEGIHSLTGLKKMDLLGSINLKEIPDLSMATSLETLNLGYCSSLVELPSFIQHLKKLNYLEMSYCENLEILPTGMNLESLERLNLWGCSRLKSFPDISSNIIGLQLRQTAIEEFPPNLRLENLAELDMWRPKSDKLWKRAQPLTPLMAMISPSLTRLVLSDIPTLVELPSSFQNLSNLEALCITSCINLETLPNGINFESLDFLNLSGCTRLRSFPDISTNISDLNLSGTGIEEVPWWIESFSNLSMIRMRKCKSLKRVFLNMSKLKRLVVVDFSGCGALTEVSLNESPSEDDEDYIPRLNINFTNCFNLNQEALIEIQTVSYGLILPGEEVPSYFTHQTSGTPSFLTIPLLPNFLSDPFFRLRVCTDLMSGSNNYGVTLKVICRFKGRSGNIFESFRQPRRYLATWTGSGLFIFECRVPLYEDNAPPLAELNYDHVDIQLHLRNLGELNYGEESTIRLKRWGVRLLNDFSSAENGLGNPNTLLPHVCEADEDYMLNDECHETEQGEECGDSLMEIERCRKRMRTT